MVVGPWFVHTLHACAHRFNDIVIHDVRFVQRPGFESKGAAFFHVLFVKRLGRGEGLALAVEQTVTAIDYCRVKHAQSAGYVG